MKYPLMQTGAASTRSRPLPLKAALVPLLLPIAAFAASPRATPTVQDIINFCEAGVQCPVNSKAYLDGTEKGSARDAEILTIVSTLAETANTPVVPMQICLEAVDGILVLSKGMYDYNRKTQVINIAEAMCIDTATASISDNGGGGGAGGGGGGGTGGDGGGGGTGGDGGGGGTGGDGGGGGTGGDGGGGGTGGDGGGGGTGGDGGGGGTGGDGGGGTGGDGGGGGTGGSSKNKSGGADGTNPGNGGNDSGYNNPGGGKKN